MRKYYSSHRAYIIILALLSICLSNFSFLQAEPNAFNQKDLYKYHWSEPDFHFLLHRYISDYDYLNCFKHIYRGYYPKLNIYSKDPNERREKIHNGISMFKSDIKKNDNDRFFYIIDTCMIKEYEDDKGALPIVYNSDFNASKYLKKIGSSKKYAIDYDIHFLPTSPFFWKVSENEANAFIDRVSKIKLIKQRDGNLHFRYCAKFKLIGVEKLPQKRKSSCMEYLDVKAKMQQIDFYPLIRRIDDKNTPVFSLDSDSLS